MSGPRASIAGKSARHGWRDPPPARGGYAGSGRRFYSGQSMIFTKEHVAAIFGVSPNTGLPKTQTRRIADTQRYKPGKEYAVCPGLGKKSIGRICITHVRREFLLHISEEDAIAEGYPSSREFLFAFDRPNNFKVHPWTRVWAYTFAPVVERAIRSQTRSDDGAH